MLTRVKTFDDGRCIDEISPAQHAHEVRVELGDLYPGRPVHFVRGEEEEEEEEKEATTTTAKKKKCNLRKKRREKKRQRGRVKESENAWTVDELRTFLLAQSTPHHLRKVKKR